MLSENTKLVEEKNRRDGLWNVIIQYIIRGIF